MKFSLFMVVTITFLVGFGFGMRFMEGFYQKQAIEHGFAYHDRETGDWKWVEDKK